MRRVIPGAVAALLVLAAAASAQDREPIKSVGALIQQPETTRIGDAELAGLPADARPRSLSIESAYALALNRTRAGQADAEKADFAQFRRAWAEGKPEAFRDPTADLLDLLALSASIENGSRSVAARSGLLGVLKELVKGNSSDLQQIEIDRASDALERDRLGREDKVRQYRDRLDALKVALGLPPRSPVALDRGPVAAFGTTFEGLIRWSTNPSRELAELDGLMSGLPGLPPPVVGDRHVLGQLDRDPTALEEVLRAASDAAAKAREGQGRGLSGDDARALELRVRVRVRRLVEARSAYRGEVRRAVLLLRVKDRAIETMVAPPQANALAVIGVAPVLDVQGQILLNQDRLVTLWASYLADKLALDREMGALPATDWRTFLGQFHARQSEAGPAGVPSPAPAPPR